MFFYSILAIEAYPEPEPGLALFEIENEKETELAKHLVFERVHRLKSLANDLKNDAIELGRKLEVLLVETVMKMLEDINNRLKQLEVHTPVGKFFLEALERLLDQAEEWLEKELKLLQHELDKHHKH